MSVHAKRLLLSAAMHLAPTGREQQAFTRLVNAMELAGESDTSTCQALLAMMLDGLRNGNWPLADQTECEE